MKRVILVAALVAAGMSASFAQSDVIAERKALMGKAIGAAFYRTMGRMVRGQDPYDQAKVDAAFVSLTDSAKKIVPLFPEGSKAKPDSTDDYDASDKIWANKADFDAKAKDFEKVLADYNGKVKNLDELKVARSAIDKACDACHDSYRVRKK